MLHGMCEYFFCFYCTSQLQLGCVHPTEPCICSRLQQVGYEYRRYLCSKGPRTNHHLTSLECLHVRWTQKKVLSVSSAGIPASSKPSQLPMAFLYSCCPRVFIHSAAAIKTMPVPPPVSPSLFVSPLLLIGADCRDGSSSTSAHFSVASYLRTARLRPGKASPANVGSPVRRCPRCIAEACELMHPRQKRCVCPVRAGREAKELKARGTCSRQQLHRYISDWFRCGAFWNRRPSNAGIGGRILFDIWGVANRSVTVKLPLFFGRRVRGLVDGTSKLCELIWRITVQSIASCSHRLRTMLGCS
ncbi:hypothetical protein V8C34DRAFT_295726 [Trichoderma compactum]